MTEFGVQNLASFMFFRVKFQLDCKPAIVQSNETVKLTEFDHLTLKFYNERELRRCYRVFPTLWTLAIRSNMVARFVQKTPSIVLNSTFNRVGWPIIEMQKHVVVCQFKLYDVYIH